MIGKEYRSSDAIGAFCVECNEAIKYSTTNPSNVQRHMDEKHSDSVQKREAEIQAQKRKFFQPQNKGVDQYFTI